MNTNKRAGLAGIAAAYALLYIVAPLALIAAGNMLLRAWG